MNTIWNAKYRGTHPANIARDLRDIALSIADGTASPLDADRLLAYAQDLDLLADIMKESR